MKIKVLIADDHPIFLDGLYSSLKLKDPELDIVGAAENGKEALLLAKRYRPQVVLLDIKMPIIDGVEAAKLIKKEIPDIKIIILTTFDDKKLIKAALKAGAIGYLLKDSRVEEIIYVIKSAIRGNVLMSSEVEKLASDENENLEKNLHKFKNEDQETDFIPVFTEREKEILSLLTMGKDNTKISEELLITEKTVRNHISNIYDVLGIHNRTQVALWALKHGF